MELYVLAHVMAQQQIKCTMLLEQLRQDAQIFVI